MMVMRSHSTFMEGWSWAVIKNIVWWLPMTIIFFFSKKDGHRKPPTSHFWWHPMTILVIYRKMMVMGSQQSPVFDACPWPSFLEKRKMMVIGSHKTLVFDDYPWPSFHIGIWNDFSWPSFSEFFKNYPIFWPKFWVFRPLQGVVYLLENLWVIGIKIHYQKVENNHQ